MPSRNNRDQEERELSIPVEKAEEICIRCGHCVAVCPHSALSLKNMKAGTVPD